MNRKEQLQKILNEYNEKKCIRIELVWEDGRRAGIGNKDAVDTAMAAIKNELKRQIDAE